MRSRIMPRPDSPTLSGDEEREEHQPPSHEEVQQALARRAQKDFDQKSGTLETQDTGLKIGAGILTVTFLASGAGLAFALGMGAMGYAAKTRMETDEKRDEAKKDLKKAGVDPEDKYSFWKLPTTASLKEQGSKVVQQGEGAVKAVTKLSGKLVNRGQHDEDERSAYTPR